MGRTDLAMGNLLSFPYAKLLHFEVDKSPAASEPKKFLCKSDCVKWQIASCAVTMGVEVVWDLIVPSTIRIRSSPVRFACRETFMGATIGFLDG